jgi:hypothetical protein
MTSSYTTMRTKDRHSSSNEDRRQMLLAFVVVAHNSIATDYPYVTNKLFNKERERDTIFLFVFFFFLHVRCYYYDVSSIR